MPANDRLQIWRMGSKRPAALLLGVLLCLLSLLAYQLWLSYRDQLRTAEISTRNLAALFDARLEATLRHADAVLTTLVRDMPPTAMIQQAVPQFAGTINARLDNQLLKVDEMAAFRFYDASGDLLYSSDSAHTRRVNLADRAHFRALRDSAEAGLVFSDALIERINGKQVVAMVRAVRDAHGEFLGSVHGLLELGHYRKQFQALELGPQGFVALRRRDTQARVVSWPPASGEAEVSLLPDHPIARRLTRGESAFALHYASAQDNVARVVGVQALRDYPFYFVVGVDEHDVLAGWWSQVRVVGTSIVLLLLLVTILVSRLKRMRLREAGILDTLAISEAHFDTLAQRLPVAVSRCAGDGRYTYVNRRLLAMSGRSRDEFLSSEWTAFVHPDDRAQLRLALAAAGREAAPVPFECRFLRADGQVLNLTGEVQAEVDVHGATRSYIVAQTDISAGKQAEAELRMARQQADGANMAKTRFLAAASHDLRQPIQAINLFRDALVRSGLSETQQRIVGFLSLSVRSLDDLLYSLLDISRLDAGLVKPQLVGVLVESLFTALDADFSSLARERRLRFKLFYPLKDMVLLTDPLLLRSILRNLVDNAFKYTERGGILIGVRRRGDRAVIQVWDTGIGIDPRLGDQVFDECFQAGNHLRDRAKGLGIGLSIARRTARLLDGDVTYRSHPGTGSVFEVSAHLAGAREATPDSMPRQAAAEAEKTNEMNETKEMGAASRLRGWQVVVVEDDPVVAKSIEISLQTLGLRVATFTDAESALASPQIMAADFYIADLILPGQSGLQLLDAIAQRVGGPINALLITGETSPGRVAHLRAVSRWMVLLKPADLSRLLEVMITVVDNRPEHPDRHNHERYA